MVVIKKLYVDEQPITEEINVNNITIENNASLDCDLVPTTDNVFNLGSSTARFKKLYTKNLENMDIRPFSNAVQLGYEGHLSNQFNVQISNDYKLLLNSVNSMQYLINNTACCFLNANGWNMQSKSILGANYIEPTAIRSTTTNSNEIKFMDSDDNILINLDQTTMDCSNLAVIASSFFIGSNSVENLFVKKDGSTTFTGDLNMGGFKISSVSNPSTTYDAVNKGYCDNFMPKAGGVLAGNITVSVADTHSIGNSTQMLNNVYTKTLTTNTAVISDMSGTVDCYISHKLQNTATNYGILLSRWSDYLTLNVGQYGVFYFSVNNVRYYKIDTTAIQPYATNVGSLGTSSRMFNSVFATTGLVSTSDASLKKDKTPLDAAKMKIFINNIEPISYKWISGPDTTSTYFGVTVQNIEEALVEADIEESTLTYAIEDAEGNPKKALNYQEMISPIISFIKSLNSEIQDLRARIVALETA